MIMSYKSYIHSTVVLEKTCLQVNIHHLEVKAQLTEVAKVSKIIWKGMGWVEDLIPTKQKPHLSTESLAKIKINWQTGGNTYNLWWIETKTCNRANPLKIRSSTCEFIGKHTCCIKLAKKKVSSNRFLHYKRSLIFSHRHKRNIDKRYK